MVPFGPLRWGVLAQHRGIDRSRSDGIDRDARSELARERPRKAEDGRLRGGIRSTMARTRERQDAGDKDHPTGFRFIQERKKTLRKLGRPEYVHFEHSSKLVRRQIAELDSWITPGIVDENVHFLPPTLDLSNQIVDFGRNSEIAGDQESVAAAPFDIRQYLFRLGPMSVEVEGYVRTLFGQSSGGRLADASRRPSNQCPHGLGY
jgi:hypothetical protein